MEKYGKQKKWPLFSKGPCSFLLPAPFQVHPVTVSSRIVREAPAGVYCAGTVCLLCYSAQSLLVGHHAGLGSSRLNICTLCVREISLRKISPKALKF